MAIDRYLLVAFVALTLGSCDSQPPREKGLLTIPFDPSPYTLSEPDRFVHMSVPADNPLTEEGVTLGRMLFFDPVLSADSTVSCATCHRPDLAFTDGQVQSAGLGARRGKRNAPSLLNVAYQTNGLFWDGRVAELEALVTHPIQDSLEMANNWSNLLAALQGHPEYPVEFRRAFGIQRREEINKGYVSRALAQYLRTLVSGDSRYDRYKAGLEAFTSSEDRGRRIFFDLEDGVPPSECGHCHVEPLFSGLEYFNNGLDEIRSGDAYSDPGRGGVNGRVGDIGAFRTPSLRNVALTAPYMHDGRFATLEEVIDHYAAGGKYNEQTHPNVHQLDLTERDKSDLIAFLRTLTDAAYGNRAE